MSARACMVMLATCLLVACQTVTETAAIVDFEVVGADSERVETLEVALRCEGDPAFPEPFSYDLTRLNADDPTNLAITLGEGERCVVEVGAQVLDGAGEPLAAGGLRFEFEDDEIRQLVLTLDTDACIDLDGDLRTAGVGGETGCPGPMDCDELDPGVHEGAAELCDGVDNDCDGGVDVDVPFEQLRDACPDWVPEQGLCRYVEPQCVAGNVVCPVLREDDDCGAGLDTNCDGRLSGCDCADVDRTGVQEGCECGEVVCLDGDVYCESVRGVIGEPCLAGGCDGDLRCDGVEPRCVPYASAAEVCDDPGGLDEDCDGAVNMEDEDCRALEVELSGVESCSEMVLLTTVSSPGDPSGCRDARSTVGCIFAGIDGGLFLDEPYVLFPQPGDSTVVAQRVEGCCECTLSYEPGELGSEVAAVHVEPQTFRRALLLHPERELSIVYSVLTNRAEFLERRLVVPVSVRGAVHNSDGDLCVSRCGLDGTELD